MSTRNVMKESISILNLPSQSSLHLYSFYYQNLKSRFTISSPLFQNNLVKIHHCKSNGLVKNMQESIKKLQKKLINSSTYYKAESLSWYSWPLLMHALTPESFHKASRAVVMEALICQCSSKHRWH